MNRPIKFRVWDVEQNKFLPSYADKGIEFYHEQGKNWHEKQIRDIVPVSWFLQDHNNNLGNYIVQQYTGLTDRNNNPIYEGDVVARHHVDLVHKVEYLSNDYYKVEYCEKEVAYICRDCDGGFVYLSDFEYIVIGNRSEKPPCKFDHNFECMVCDGWPSDCPFVKFDKNKSSFDKNKTTTV